jgi:hypothetical protein
MFEKLQELMLSKLMEQAIYVPLQGMHTQSREETPFELLEKVTRFLQGEKANKETKETKEEKISIKKDDKLTNTSLSSSFLSSSSSSFSSTALSSSSSSSLSPSSSSSIQLSTLSQSTVSKTDYEPKVLLLLGDAGSGKSVFCQDLIRQLWKNYQKGDAIPVWISLPELENPTDKAIEEALANYGFKSEEIVTLKKEQKFIFILDAFDEIHQWKNLYVSNKLSEWNAKVIITCRSQALYSQNDYDKYFVPFANEKRQGHLLRQIYVAPFSEKQIEAYLKQYADYQKKQNDDRKPVIYEQLTSVPGLKQLITTPFLLHLAVEALPDILLKYADQSKDLKEIKETKETKEEKRTQQKTQPSPTQQYLTQAELYDVFIEGYFKRQEKKLKESGHVEKDQDPKPSFWKFCKELALQMRVQECTYATLSNKTKSSQTKNPWEVFFKADKQLELIRSACPLQKLNENQYGF